MKYLSVLFFLAFAGCDSNSTESGISIYDLPVCSHWVSPRGPFIPVVLLEDKDRYQVNGIEYEGFGLVYQLRDAVRRSEAKRNRFLVRVSKDDRADRFLNLAATITDDLKTDYGFCLECLQLGPGEPIEGGIKQSSIFIWPRTYRSVPKPLVGCDLCVLEITGEGFIFNEAKLDLPEVKERLSTLLDAAELLETTAICIVKVDESATVQQLVSAFDLHSFSSDDLVLVFPKI